MNKETTPKILYMKLKSSKSFYYSSAKCLFTDSNATAETLNLVCTVGPKSSSIKLSRAMSDSPCDCFEDDINTPTDPSEKSKCKTNIKNNTSLTTICSPTTMGSIEVETSKRKTFTSVKLNEQKRKKSKIYLVRDNLMKALME